MSPSTRNPSNWDEYQYGTSHRDSVSSAGGRSVRWSDHGGDRSPSEGPAHPGVRGSDAGHENDGTRKVRRRSSVAAHLNALTQIGGPNSIENFARSWQRAIGFHEVAPGRPSFILSTDNEDSSQYGRTDVESERHERSSLLRAQLENPLAADEGVIEDTEDEDLGPEIEHVRSRSSGRFSQSIFAIAPHLSSPLAGSYGTSYGTLHSVLNESSMVHAGQLWRQQQTAGESNFGTERELLLVKEVEEDGKVKRVVIGQSTLPQTVANSINTLMGIGILSLPRAFSYSGWIPGMTFFLFAALTTQYTAKLLAKCMDLDTNLVTFADLAFIAYGAKARNIVGGLFTFELMMACVALNILFGDELHEIFPSIGVNEWKILCGLLLIPLNFLPFKLLSFTSLLGILSVFSIVAIIFFDGIIKPHSPGSLREPAATYLFPLNWLQLPKSFGLLMSLWGGHSVFPTVYADMRHREKYGKAVDITFSFTSLLLIATAVAGFLMFGVAVMDEITSNLLNTKGYPRGASIAVSIFIAIIPLTKLPLNTRPIIATIDKIAGVSPEDISDSPPLVGMTSWTRGLLTITNRVMLAILCVIISILFPSFDSIMSFMGSALCNLICIILPLMFHLKLFGTEIGTSERLLNYFLMTISSILAIVGTGFALLPKSMIEG